MDRRIREYYVIEKAALILYVVGAVGAIVLAAQGEWLRAGVTVAVVVSLWLVVAIRAARQSDAELERYEREIAERSYVRRRRHEMQRRRNHR